MNIRRRIFLVGCPRSGTTLLQCLIGAHSEVATYPETGMFYHTIPRYALAKRLQVASRGSRARFIEFTNEIGRAELADCFPPPLLSIGESISIWTKLLDELTLEQGKSVWLEKTPPHIDFIPAIEHYVPDARFIHLIRSGSDTIASMWDQAEKARQRTGTAWSLDDCINRWVSAVQVSRKYQSQPRHLILRYEGVVGETKAALTEVCDFMRLSYESEMMQQYPLVAQKVVLPSEQDCKAGASQPIQNANRRKFGKLFSEQEQAYILQRIETVEVPQDNGKGPVLGRDFGATSNETILAD